jgi:hypothetical protein
MAKMTQKKLIDNCSLPASLVLAVVRQSGGWEDFTEMALDVANHGAAGGFHGWIYYTETMAFTRRNKAAILEALKEMASDLGEGVLEMVAGFGVFRNDKPSVDEVARAIYQGKGEIADQVLNVLAWFALEETARAYADLSED